MKTGVAAVALAASALLAPTATADTRHHGPKLNGFGQTFEEAKYLADEASYACACQLELDGHKYGFKDAGFQGTPYIDQIGKNRFIIKGTAKLFDGYNYTSQHYECSVRRGNIRGATRLSPANYASLRSRRRVRSFGSFGFSFGSRW